MTAQAQLETLKYRKASKNTYLGVGFVHRDSVIEVDGDRFLNVLSIQKDSFDNSVSCIVKTTKQKRSFVFGILGYKDSRKLSTIESHYFIMHIRDYAVHIPTDDLYIWVVKEAQK